jgi:hypothetical protein
MSAKPRTKPIAGNKDGTNDLRVIWSAPDKDGNIRKLVDNRGNEKTFDTPKYRVTVKRKD